MTINHAYELLVLLLLARIALSLNTANVLLHGILSQYDPLDDAQVPEMWIH